MNPQAQEIATLMERKKIPLQRIADEAALKVSTLKRVINGSYELDEASMRSIRLIDPVGSYGTKLEPVPFPGAERVKTRMIPVVSWVQAGQAVAYDDLPADWMRLTPTDSDDPHAFAVEIVGDSMDPEFREGGIATLIPSHEVRNNDVVVASAKNKGPMMKRFQRTEKKVRLVSANSAYEPMEFSPTDFHWVYPVYSVTYKVKRR